jgi:hypothetical protein
VGCKHAPEFARSFLRAATKTAIGAIARFLLQFPTLSTPPREKLRALEGSRDSMDAVKSQSATPAPKRRWFQISLRSLMLFVLLCSIACSWYATRAANQREAVRAILDAEGCTVAYDCDNGLHDLAPIVAAMTGQPLPERRETWVEGLLGKDFVHDAVEAEVPLDKLSMTISQLARLPHLKRLDIRAEDRDSNDAIDAAGKLAEQELPGVETRVVQYDFNIANNTDESAAQTADTDLRIGDFYWTDDTTVAVANTAAWIGLLIAL